MIRSNSRQAIDNIRGYIIKHFDGSNYDGLGHIDDAIAAGAPVSDVWPMVKTAIIDTFKSEMLVHNLAFKRGRVSRQTVFFDWCQGLPSIIDTCYYYNRSAVDDLAMILQESDAEKNKYTEAKAETMLTWLLYREIFKGVH